MGSKLRRNAIITGYINAYCLVCECSVDSFDETITHIQEDTHAGKLLAHPYLDKYGDNHIRKVRKGYFCEFCSILLATAAKVSLHVQEKSHYEKKGTFLLRRPSGTTAVLAFEDILISDRAWHGLSDDTCAICNEEFENENIHKTESGHLLKLVQIKVEFGVGNSVYRRTDDSSFQCITCNSVFALDSFNEHFIDAEHKKSYAKCQEELRKYNDQNKNKADEKSVDEKTNEDAKSIDKNHDTTSKEYKTNAKEEAGAQKQDCKDVSLETNAVKAVEDEISVYASDNNITHNTGNTNAFCRICETKLPANLRSMKEHANGKEHKNKMALTAQLTMAAKKAPKPDYTKCPVTKFIVDIANARTTFHQDVIINLKYCVPLPSYILISGEIGSKFRCLLCEVDLNENKYDVRNHVENSQHERLLKELFVITSLPSEFLREVRLREFHCGYCNVLLPQWEAVASHLRTREHKENKDASAWRLQRHLPSISDLHRRHHMELLKIQRQRNDFF